MQICFCMDVGGEKIAVVENVLECCNLHCIIVVPWRSPADVTLQILLPEEGNREDLLFNIRKKTPIRFFASDFQGSSDVLKKMHMAQLGNTTGKDVCSCHANRFIVVAGDAAQHVAGVLQFREELHQPLVVLAEQ